MVPLEVPNDVPAVSYPLLISFGAERIEKPLTVVAPVTVDLSLPNGQQDVLWAKLKNATKEFLRVSMELSAHPAWTFGRRVTGIIALTPGEERRVEVPLTLTGYDPENQLYAVRARLQSEGFQTEAVRGFYVGVAHFASTAPSLDGSWEGWERKNPITIDKASQVCKLLMGNQPWQGPQDLSAKIYAMYDDTSLYVGAEVTDDVVVTHWDFPTMSYPWDTDCMEVVLDTRTNSEQGHDPPTPGLFRHLSMAEFKTTDFGPTMWQGGGAGGPLLPKPNLVPGAETYFLRTEEGYNIICRYPLSSLKGVVAKPGYKIGFDVAINDNDGTNYRKNQHIWAGF
ncbi:MAG: sugar-binding protein, partial [Bacteroidota bacterium]